MGDMTTATRTLPEHGTLYLHKKHGCRCTDCCRASREYDLNRNRQIAYGRWTHPVDAQIVRDHIAELAEAGIGWMRVAELAGLSSGILSRWLYGSANCPPARRVKAANAALVLAVKPTLDNAAGHALIDATGTRRRVQGLICVGFPQSFLAVRIGWDKSNFGRLIDATLVHAVTARKVRALFAELITVLPEDRGVSRHSASRARNQGLRKGWAPGGAWDAIDDPDAVPDLGAPADPVLALIENADFIRDTDSATWQHTAERLGVDVNTLHTYRSRARERAAASAGSAS